MPFYSFIFTKYITTDAPDLCSFMYNCNSLLFCWMILIPFQAWKYWLYSIFLFLRWMVLLW